MPEALVVALFYFHTSCSHLARFLPNPRAGCLAHLSGGLLLACVAETAIASALAASLMDGSTGHQPSPSTGCAEASQFRAVNVRKPNDGGSCTNWPCAWKLQAGSLLSRSFELAFPLSALKF